MDNRYNTNGTTKLASMSRKFSIISIVLLSGYALFMIWSDGEYSASHYAPALSTREAATQETNDTTETTDSTDSADATKTSDSTNHPAIMEEGTIIAVINTEKCGTGSMQSSFKNSLRCYKGGPAYKQARIYYGCHHGGELIRTHSSHVGAKAIEMLRQDHPEKKCIITSALRSPQTWIPSTFMQSSTLCNADVTYEEFEQAYHDYIMKAQNGNGIGGPMTGTRSHLMQEFGTSLPEVMTAMKANNGYSLHDIPSDYESDGPFSNCQLVFLQMESGDQWHDIFSKLFPGVNYWPNQPRTEACPKIAEHYKAIEKRRFTEEERAAIIGGHENSVVVEEYFNVYGL